MRFFPVALRIGVWSVLFLALFAATALSVALLLAWVQGTWVTDTANLYLGMVCGLIAWFFIAVFHLRRESLHLPFADQKIFLDRVKTVLGELGYEVSGQTADQIRFHPSFTAFLLGGGVLVKVNGGTGSVTGPRVSLEMLRRRLRLLQHLDKVQQSFQEGRRRKTEFFHKRVQVSLRLPNDKWADVVEHLQGALSKEGILVGDLHLLVQSETGIRESVVEAKVRTWLQERGIPVEIQKDHVQRLEPPVSPEIPEKIPV